MFDGIQGNWRGNCASMAQTKAAKDPELAARMVQLRESLGFKTGVAMAEWLGVIPQRWNNVENGFPLGKDLAGTIKKKVPGIDLDWLHDGDLDGLPFNLRAALETEGGLSVLVKAPKPERPARRR